MKKGNITVFLAMTLPLVLALLFSLIETARIAGVRPAAKAAGDAAVNSLFAAFNRTVFDEYGLLFFDGGYGNGLVRFDGVEAEFEECFNDNRNHGSLLGGSFFPMEIAEAHVTNIVTATDYNGEILIRSALDFFKFDAAGALLEEVKGYVTGMEDGDAARAQGKSDTKKLEQTDWSEYTVGTAMSELSGTPTYMNLISKTGKAEFSTLQNVVASEGGNSGGGSSEAGDPEEEEKEHIDDKKLKSDIKDSAIGAADRAKASGWLSLVVPSEVTISGYQFSADDLPSVSAVDNRSLEHQPSILSDALKRITFCEYLMQHFSNYSNEAGGAGPAYQVEYILFGDRSDKKNFETALNRIMWIREGMNLLYLATSEKLEEAESAASALVGWTGNPIIIALTCAALLAAWAYAESILDCRALLQKKKVAFYKTEETWTLSFAGIANLLAGGGVATKECETGLRYEDYLRIMLYVSDLPTGAYRAMDLIQENMRQRSAPFLMASQIYALEFTVTFSAGGLFALLPVNRKTGVFYHRYVWTEKFSEVY